MDYIESIHFDEENFSIRYPEKAEYEQCIFTNCDFSGCNLSEFIFSECSFRDCNLSLVKTGNTAFRNIVFTDCKIIGVNFDHCNQFGIKMSFEGCMLDNSSFYNMKMSATQFKKSRLHETDFTDCDLKKSVFDNCDLLKSVFANTNIENCDLSTSENFSIDPGNNNIMKAKFSLTGLPGLLEKYGIEIIL